MNQLTYILKDSEKIKQITKLARKGSEFMVYDVADAQKRHLAHTIAELSGLKGLYIAWNEMQARQAYADISSFTDRNAVFLSNREIMLYDIEARSFEQTYERIATLVKVLRNDYSFIVTSAEALMHFLMPPDAFSSFLISLKPGQSIEIESLQKKFLEMGYRREEKVEGRGQFAIRGGIVDIFPVNTDNPCRLEFFDIEIDSMRWFSHENQRSIDNCELLEIYPAREIVYKRADIKDISVKIENALSETISNVSSGISKLLEKNISMYLDKLNDNHYFTGLDKFIPFLLKEKASFFDYLTERHLVIIEEPEKIRERMVNEQESLNNLCETLLEKGMILKDTFSILYGIDDVLHKARKHSLMTVSAFDGSLPDFSGVEKFQIKGSGMGNYNGKLDMLTSDIKRWAKDNYRIFILCSTAERMDRLSESLREEGIKLFANRNNLPWPEETSVIMGIGSISTGFVYRDEKLAVISENDILTVKARMPRRKAAQKGKRISSFTDLKAGDYVVHQTHGIGIYNGIEQLEVEGIRRDYLKISYRDGGNLYIPTTGMDLIQKYIGSEGREPKLHKLGGTEWVKTKAKVKESLKQLADKLIRLQAERQSMKGHAFSKDTVWQKQFEETFEFEETPDQLRCIQEVKEDMESETIMDRLLCGDVGYGKTEVALRSAFKAIMDGKQVAFLVPTTVLASQHFENFKKRFDGFPVNIEMLSRFKTGTEQKQIIKDLKSGRIDILIGTHMMLSKSIKFKDLGLLVIDEEQRFGVEHKETIKARYPKVDILTLSATPIPRTLNMALSGLRDISTLEDPPLDRYPVQTYVLEYRDDIVRDAINKELARDGQVFYLYNKVRGILARVTHVQKLVPNARVGYAHGQMGERELERIIQAFIDRELDVLVCTTIIESGIDMPNVNTIIVEDSDRLGLAQLYQLRGRVGRSNRLAYAYLTCKKDKVINETAEKRLKAIKEFTEFGSGFKIAMRDLQIRGAGNILGSEQHGHMELVGYDMYLRLLNETIAEIKGEPQKAHAGLPKKL
jgi:transcription-repair coupling factor (superfamily II helicase)